MVLVDGGKVLLIVWVVVELQRFAGVDCPLVSFCLLVMGLYVFVGG